MPRQLVTKLSPFFFIVKYNGITTQKFFPFEQWRWSDNWLILSCPSETFFLEKSHLQFFITFFQSLKNKKENQCECGLIFYNFSIVWILVLLLLLYTLKVHTHFLCSLFWLGVWMSFVLKWNWKSVYEEKVHL